MTEVSRPKLAYLNFTLHYFSNSRGAALIHLQDILHNQLSCLCSGLLV